MAGRTADRARAGAPEPLLPGFTILTRLAQGGMATVYVAVQDALDRRVAVKVINSPVDDAKVMRDFDREARAIARLSSHPHVLTVYTTGQTADGRPFLVTELCDGGSLADLVNREGRLPPSDVARIGASVADALAAAHAKGILHRDVKPGNVLLDSSGHVKLGDFGIAKLVAGHSTTTTGVVAFTPEHVAPEILRGEPEGPWSDVYGLASTLAAAGTGASLFAQRPGERIEALLTRKLMAPPPSLDGVLPPGLAAPLTRALDPDPTGRPDLAELRRELTAFDASMTPLAPSGVSAPAPASAPVEAAPAPIPLIGRPWERRRRLLPVALAAAVLAVVLVVWFAVRIGDDPGDEAASPPTGPATTTALGRVTTTPTATEVAAVSTSVSTAVTPASPTTVPTASPTTVSTASTASTGSTASTVAPTTASPTTASPTAASPTAASPTAASPTAASPTTASPTRVSSVITSSEAETFLRSYYGLVDDSDYAASWAQLAPEFQRGKARSFDYYVEFWDDNDLEVGSVSLVESAIDRAVVRAQLYWDGSDEAVTDEFVLRRVADGQLLIAEQTTVDDD